MPTRRGLAPTEHLATRLIALSFDSAASPKFTLGGFKQRHEGRAYGWGFAWYPEQTGAALVVKDATSVGENAMTKLLREWDRFESTLFVAHLRGAARTLMERDTHPFSRAHGGRDWVFAHNGDLASEEAPLREALPLGGGPMHEPIGRTDSEHAFCWLLNRAMQMQARTLADVGWPTLHGWMRELNRLGTANLMVSDGHDLAVYTDAEGYNPLHVGRLLPPHVPEELRTEEFTVGLDDARERTRTVLIFSTQPLVEDRFVAMEPGQLIVARRGAYIFDSHADAQAQRLMVAPVPSTPPQRTPPDVRPTSPTQRPVGDQLQSTGEGSDAMALPQQEPMRDDVTGGPTPPPMPAAPTPPAPGPSGSAGAPPPPAAPALGAEAAGPAGPESVSVPVSEPTAPPLTRVVVPPLHFHARRAPGRLLSVRHRTTYRYSKPVERSFHLFRLQPVHDRRQDLLEYKFNVTVDGLFRSYDDVFGNNVVTAEIEQPFEELIVSAHSLVRVREGGAPDLHSPHRRHNIPLVWMPWQRQMMTPYLLPQELPETQLRELSDFAMSFVERQDYDLVQTLLDMNTTIYRDFAYVSGSTTMATTPFQVYTHRKGVCQDFANLLICLARLLGIPARYRVGYIYTGADYENTVQSDASHAWAELYLPWTGWQGFDPTNGVLVNQDHVVVACGRNYGDATPTSGTLYKGGGKEDLRVDVKVEEVEPAV